MEYLVNSNFPIVCIGGANLDIKAKVIDRLVVYSSNPIRSFSSFGGVARNVAENLARLDESVALISRIGKDSNGERLKETLKDLEIDITGVSHSLNYPTATYTALLESTGEMYVALADMEIYQEMTPHLLKAYSDLLLNTSFLILDTNLSEESLVYLTHFVDPKVPKWAVPVSVPKVDRLKPVLSSLTGIVLNRDELSALLQRPLKDHQSIKNAAAELLSQGLMNVVVTCGSEGVISGSGKDFQWTRMKRDLPNEDVTGAGDAFSAGLFYGLKRQRPLEEAIRLGFAAASLTLQSSSTVSPELDPEKLIEEAEKLSIEYSEI